MADFYDIVKNAFSGIRKIYTRRKVFSLIIIIASISGIIFGIFSFKQNVFGKLLCYEYYLKNSFAIFNQKIGKIILSGILTIVCNFIFILLFSFCKYLSPVAIFICFVKGYALTQTFTVFFKTLGLINFIVTAVILLPFELLFYAIYIFSYITAFDVVKSCERNGFLRILFLCLASCTAFILSVLLIKTLFVVLYSKTL